MDVFGRLQSAPKGATREAPLDLAGVLRDPWSPPAGVSASGLWAVRAAWIYALTAFALLAAMPTDHPLVDWVAYPLHALILGLSLRLAWQYRRRSPLTSAIGWLAALNSLLFCLANYAWNYLRPFNGVPKFDYSDVLFFANYGALFSLTAVMFVRQGGSFRRVRTWLDALTIFTSFSVAFWSVLRGMVLLRIVPTAYSIFTLPYAVALALLMTMGALLWIQNARGGHAAAILLALATLVTASGEFAWLANWLEETDLVGDFYPVIQSVAAMLLVNAMVRIADRSGDPDPTTVALSAQNFLPVLGISLSMALIAGVLGTTRQPAPWLMIVFMLLVLMLLVTREASVRRELATLRQGLARRAADERLTELIRRSSDLIVVGDRNGVIAYASPAAQQIVGVAAEQLVGTPMPLLFGAQHRPSMTTLLDTLSAGAGREWEIEIIHPGADGPDRVHKLTGVNQLDNPLIAGLVLTVKDITAQRAIERQMLDVVTHERVRLAGDLHDGLGQELTGIAMLLQGVATTPNAQPETVKAELHEIIAHLNRAVAGTRGLAHGLAPVKVVSGSLARALQLLAREIAERYHIVVDVEIEAAAEGCDMVEAAADHLYRIAQEALVNAARHGGCRRARLGLSVEGQLLCLRISDDGGGFEPNRPGRPGIGLQLMEFRARIIGGRFAVAGRGHPGARIDVHVPLSRISCVGAGVG